MPFSDTDKAKAIAAVYESQAAWMVRRDPENNARLKRLADSVFASLEEIRPTLTISPDRDKLIDLCYSRAALAPDWEDTTAFVKGATLAPILLLIIKIIIGILVDWWLKNTLLIQGT